MGNHAVENPYLAARLEWNERYHGFIRAKRNWQITALAALLVNAALGIGILWQASQSKVTPYVIEVDQLGEAVDELERLYLEELGDLVEALHVREFGRAMKMLGAGDVDAFMDLHDPSFVMRDHRQVTQDGVISGVVHQRLLVNIDGLGILALLLDVAMTDGDENLRGVGVALERLGKDLHGRVIQPVLRRITSAQQPQPGGEVGRWVKEAVTLGPGELGQDLHQAAGIGAAAGGGKKP